MSHQTLPVVPHPTTTARAVRHQQTDDLVEELRTCPASERPALRRRVVLTNLPTADSIASRYAGRGVPVEDLRQVAYLALVRAVERFDPDAGYSFFAYSVPTMRGEVRRYFRDLGWTVRPPRRIQELQRQVRIAEAELTMSDGHRPSAAQLARRLDESEVDVREAMAGEGAFHPASLDRPVGESGSSPLGELLGADDPGQAAAEARVTLLPVLATLSDRDRRILLLRFFHDLTQKEIAAEIGVTQMQVSRILTRIFRVLRARLGAIDVETPGAA